MTFVSRYLPYWYLFFLLPLFIFKISVDVFCGGGGQLIANIIFIFNRKIYLNVLKRLMTAHFLSFHCSQALISVSNDRFLSEEKL